MVNLLEWVTTGCQGAWGWRWNMAIPLLLLENITVYEWWVTLQLGMEDQWDHDRIWVLGYKAGIEWICGLRPGSGCGFRSGYWHISHSIKQHEIHPGIVFQQLQNHHLLLSKGKVDLYFKRLECLGHIIDDWGIHTDADKIQCIWKWRCPRTFNNIQHFLWLVQYLAHYMPDISTYTTPLSGCVRNSHPLEWMPLLDKCFESIKALACRAPILKPIDT